MMMREMPCASTPCRGREVPAMGTMEIAAGTPAVGSQVLESYEPPAVSELGTVEDLTWDGSTDFYLST